MKENQNFLPISVGILPNAKVEFSSIFSSSPWAINDWSLADWLNAQITVA